MAERAKGVPEGHRTVTPYLVVTDGDGYLAFLEKAFGGAVLERHHDPEGRLQHAEVRIGDSRVMVGQGNEEWPPTRAIIHLYVEDADAMHAQAVSAGARSVRDPVDMEYGDRSGGVEDPSGNQWWVATRLESR